MSYVIYVNNLTYNLMFFNISMILCKHNSYYRFKIMFNNNLIFINII